MKNKIKFFLDGADQASIKKYKPKVDGFTFNPTLFRKLNAKNYIEFSKKIIKLCGDKHISLEVIADDENNIIRQAKKLNSLGKNVYVKVPIVYRNGKSTKNAIKKLIKLNIKLNITAIFTVKQITTILPYIKKTNTILSVFAGRIFDLGIDATKVCETISRKCKSTKCKLLWASPRMSFDIINAKKSNFDIITLPVEIYKKTKLFNKKPFDYSVDTVKMFYNDAKKAKYTL